MTKNYRVPIVKVQMVREGTHTGEGSRPQVSSPKDVAVLLQDYIGNVDREHFVIILLNIKNKIIGINTVSIGSLSSSIVHPREIYKAALLANAGSIILAHNHPSGDLTPSPEDISVTKRVCEAGEIIGVQVLDHIIVSDEGFYSFREGGLM